MYRTALSLLALFSLGSLGATGCAVDAADAETEIGTTDSDLRRRGRRGPDGRRLFDVETFDGNGRTCRTCHNLLTGTFSPEKAQLLYRFNPDAPLFRSIDSDDGIGDSYDLLLTHATVRVGIALPDHVRIEGEPEQRTVVFRRGVPSTMNTPALDGVLMLDGRAPSLEAQAADAIAGHAEAGRVPTDGELAAIAEFEQTAPRFFSSWKLRRYANGGDAPELPVGRTASEKRGRAFFVEGGRCAGCHGGPMLNETSRGSRFLSAGVSDRKELGKPVHRFVFTADDGTETAFDSPDPGRALITGDPDDADRFKIPSLWGIARTAPYFHDNSAKTLADVAEHYSFFFESRGRDPLTDEEQADIVAYMKLLR